MPVLLRDIPMVPIAFYSHDTTGLGHLRRSLKLASAMAELQTDVEGILITGSPWAHLFPCPPGFELVRLAPILKRGSGYQPGQRGLELAEVLRFRTRTLIAVLTGYRPDLLIVDNVPCGLKGEMLPALRRLRGEAGTVCVLALRDILDRNRQISREWGESGAAEALEDLYHEVWVFGDRLDRQEMLALPGMAAAESNLCGRIGLVDGFDEKPRAARLRRVGVPGESIPRVLVTGGGGRDADHLVGTYLEMLRLRQPRIASHIVLGPDFPGRRLRELTSNNGFNARIDPFVQDLPAAMRAADLVVAMAGYNTTCEIESLGKRSILVPRVWPRQEQLLRALKQERAGRARLLHPDGLTPEDLWSAIEMGLAEPSPRCIHHMGAQLAGLHAARLLGRDWRSRPARIAS